MRNWTAGLAGSSFIGFVLSAGLVASGAWLPSIAAAAAPGGEIPTLLVTSSLDTGDDATIGVDLEADALDGAGLSLREALAWAEPGDTIGFDLDDAAPGYQGGTIILGGSALEIAVDAVRINGDVDGDGVPDVTLDANDLSGVLVVQTGLTGIELDGLVLTRGVSTRGGGLWLQDAVDVTLRNCRVTDSASTGSAGGGGGIFGNNVNLTLVDTTVSNNTASSWGGGIRAVGISNLTLVNSTVSGNTTTGQARNGGGIQFAGPLLTLVNSTISGNAATGSSTYGGGVRVSAGSFIVHNSTIVGNAAYVGGGGIFVSTGVNSVVNTVIAGNTAGADAVPGAGGSPLATGGVADDVAGMLDIATSSYFGTEPTITTNDGSFTDQGTANLLLGDLGYHFDGRVPTHFPHGDSDLRERGNAAALPADQFDLDQDGNVAEPLPLDANRWPRVGELLDIGAVEANGIVEIFADDFES